MVRTKNKKYFKRIQIPDLERLDLEIQPKDISQRYEFNTLTISYLKPETVLDLERNIRQKFDELNAKNPKNGDLECSTH